MNYVKIIKEALREDIGKGDITTKSIIPKNKFIKAALVAKEPCVICGLSQAQAAFKLRDKNIKFRPRVKEGQKIKRGEVIALVSGRARAILSAERVALNFLTLLSGIATKTSKYVNSVKQYKVKILDTRKTLPDLRELEKYAVRIGGGYNHRMSLDEMFLIKDNHLRILKGLRGLNGVKGLRGRGYQVEIEVKNIKEFKQAISLNPHIIMLDNMKIKDIERAVSIRNNLRLATYELSPKLEASGGINLKNIKQFAACGVDFISVGDLTHSVKSVDISLEVV